MKYKLLATDMDGTVLNDKKELTPRTVAAMNKAIAQGKYVMFSTGRSISLVKPYIDMVQGMKYAITCSGASVIDLETNEKLLYKTMDPETVKHIIAAASGSYAMPIMFRNDKSYGQRWCVEDCAGFGVAAYEGVYRSCMQIVDDIFADFMEHPCELEKFNLFFGNDYEAGEIYEKIKELPLTFTSFTKHTLEINASGVSKAEGLKAVCNRLGISLDECIAVGDAENDEEMLTCAGLNVAVANGTDKIKALANVITDDCNHDGVAKIIEQYLLD